LSLLTTRSMWLCGFLDRMVRLNGQHVRSVAPFIEEVMRPTGEVRQEHPGL